MKRFYFGRKGNLFGVLHPAASSVSGGIGVVLAGAFGKEYLRSHQTMVRLSNRLATLGFSVLRFDYSGTGDSAGESADLSLDDWISDIGEAMEKLKSETGGKNSCLIGFRLGGALAANYHRRYGSVGGLVLWDPISDIDKYFEDLRAQKKSWLLGTFCEMGQWGKRRGELFGFHEPRRGEIGMDKVEPLRMRPSMGSKVLLIGAAGSEFHGPLTEELHGRGLTVDFRLTKDKMPGEAAAEKSGKFYHALESTSIICDWMKKGC